MAGGREARAPRGCHDSRQPWGPVGKSSWARVPGLGVRRLERGAWVYFPLYLGFL